MPRKPKMFRTGIKAVSKQGKKDITETLERYLDKPEMFLSECTSTCSYCPFSSLKIKLNNLKEHIGSPFWIALHSFSLSQLEKAYLDFQEIIEKGDITHTAVISAGEEKLYYVHGRRSAKETIVGLEYYYKPHVHLLAFTDYIKKGYVFYITNKKLLCAGKEGIVPEEFLTFFTGKVPYNFVREKAVMHTRSRRGPVLSLSIPGIEFQISKDDSSDSLSLANELSRYIGVNRADRFVEVSARIVIEGMEDKAEQINRYDLKEYQRGEISDRTLVSRVTEVYVGNLMKTRNRLFIKNWKSFGDDYKKFLEGIDTKEHELISLENLLKKVDHPVIFEGETGSKLLSLLWNDHKSELVEPFDAADTAEVAAENSSGYLHSLWKKKRSIEKTSILPELTDQSENLIFLDKIIRIYRSEGADAVKKFYKNYKGNNFSTHSMAYAIFKLVHSENEIIWSLTKDEIDHGEAMIGDLNALLFLLKGDEYINAMKSFKDRYSL